MSGDGQEGHTLAPPPSGALGPEHPTRIGPFTILGLLGTGGMGTVYLGYDPTLQRRVAIKRVHSGAPEALARLQQEAQLQARVEHPAICRIYHVGVEEGRPFIAMQYIHGGTLSQAAPRLSVMEKARLMAQVADALHAAHRQGLIHRDLKPANVMVEKDEADGLHPYLVDFGLARDWEGGGLTQAGAVVGTPAYMAPEQVREEEVDFRTDVYGLGATLYELLGGQPVFQGRSPTETLMKVLEEEPVPLRTLQPSLPPDLASIVHTCLEKAPAQRYASAKELRDDLQRFLDGEPILARRPGLLERLRRRWRRHRVVGSLGLAALLLLLALVGTLVWTRLQRGSQMLWAQRYGQEIVEMEGILRAGHMLPLHDTAAERRVVRRRMDAIRRQMAPQGSALRGPGHLALGRGHLLLGEPALAQKELEAAWSLGYQGPEVRLALGRALAELFLEARQEAESLPSPLARSQRLQELERSLRQPAAAHIRSARAALGDLPTADEVRLAFIEQRPEEAVRTAEALYQAEPWRCEVLVEAAMALVWEVPGLLATGRKDEARTLLERGLDLLETPSRISPSHTLLHMVTRRTWALGLSLGLRGQGPEDCLRWALEAQARALQSSSEPSGLGVDAALLHHLRGRLAMAQGKDPEGDWATAQSLAEGVAQDAREGDQARARAHEELALLWAERIWRGERHGGIPPEARAKVLAHGEAALKTGKASWKSYDALGFAHLTLGKALFEAGKDPGEHLEQAAHLLRKASEITPDPDRRSNLAGALRLLAQQRMPTGKGVQEPLAEAIGLLQEELAKPNPAPRFQQLLGLNLLTRAEAQAKEGQPFSSSLGAARSAFEAHHRATG